MSTARCPTPAATPRCLSMMTPATSLSAAPTNVKKENGDRAVGTQLAPDHPGQAVLRKGQAYKGPAVLFGKTFMTAYYPVVNSSAKVVGIIYVGIAMAEFESMLAQAIQTMAIAAGIAALLVLVLTMLIVRRMTKPLTSVTASLTAIANGKADVAIDCDDRIGRDRRDCAYPRRLQEQLGRTPPDARRADRGRRCRRRTTQGRTARFRRRVPDQRRQHPRQGDELLQRIRARRAPAHRDRADHRRALRQVGGRLGNRLRACPHRGDRFRRTVQLDRRNHPPGPGVERHRGRRRRAGGSHRPAHQRTVAKPAPGSATSSS